MADDPASHSRYHKGTGNRYQDVVLSDSSRSHLGDVVNINNYSGPGGPSEEDKRWKEFKEALSFDSMEARRRNVDPAYGDTCRWVLGTGEYRRWRDEGFRSRHHGFLWIKGNPGVGKSTIMKFLLEHAQRHMPEHIILSFFFNARGGSLETSTEGMYRSLLLQLLENVPGLHHEFRIPDTPGQEQHWPVNVVQDYFREALLLSSQTPATIFIDALDEGDQKQVRDMVGYFGKLAAHARLNNTSLSICFASRHYPSITTRFREELVIDGQHSHEDDIRKYVSENLAADLIVRRLDLEWEVVSRSQGVFLWVVLVVSMLNESFDQGYTADQLVNTLNTIPEDLDGLFTDILRVGASDDCLLPALQCVIARIDSQMFGIAQLYFAIHIGTGRLASPVWDHGEFDEATMKRFILRSTKGLVEIVSHDGFDRIQFVHESVREHLLGGGLSNLHSLPGDSVEAHCHAKLADWCQAYIRLVDPEQLAQSAAPLGYTVDEHPDELAHRFDTKLPLLRYASRHLMWHMNDAYAAGAYTLQSLISFPLSMWIKIDEHIRQNDKGYRPSVSLLCLFVEHDCFSLAIDILEHYKMQLHHEPTGSVIVQTMDDHLIDTLVGPSLDATQGRDGRTILMAAAEKGHDAIARLLLECGANVNHLTDDGDSALTRALHSDHVNTVRLLLNSGAAIQIDGCEFDDPLQSAVNHRSMAMVELLLEHGADINAVDGYYGTALATAAYEGDLEMVEMMLLRGANVNIVGGKFGTALAAALLSLSRESDDIVELLLRHGAEDNRSDDDEIRNIMTISF